eukprot:GHVL01024780.1.p1 GENE.GHVL01024780.1~~GHVL01024780.1.p1  ORF type:complete len:653 (+),score=139.80 GHVL01024780.1:28-1986(+)
MDDVEQQEIEAPSPVNKTPSADEIAVLSRVKFGHPRDNEKVVSGLFWSVFFIQLLVNYDSGALPAVVDLLETEFGLKEFDLGLLGALPYIGFTASSMFSGRLLQTLSQKGVLITLLLLNAVSCLLLAFANGRPLLYISRILIGMTQAAFVIYSPVWIDEFAPPSRVALWLGLVQASAVIGVMFGYLIAGYSHTVSLSWRYAIGLQAALLVPFAIGMIFCPKKFINIPDHAELQAQFLAQYEKHMSELANKNTESLPPPIKNDVNDNDVHVHFPETIYPSTNTSPPRQTVSESGVYDDEYHRRVSIHNRWDPYSTSSRADIVDDDTESIKSAAVMAASSLIFASPAAGVFSAVQMARSATSANLQTPSGSPVGSCTQSLEFRKCLSRQDLNKSEQHDKTEVLRIPEAVELEEAAMKQKKVHESPLRQLVKLARNGIFMWMVVALCALYFVVTGVQFWTTKYLLGAYPSVKREAILAAFAITAATAPTLGVLFGGVTVSLIGGYKTPRGLNRTILFIIMCGAVATAAGLVAGFVGGYWAFVGLLWVILLFGGAILPPATGILIFVVDIDSRAFTSSVSMFLYNIFGYALGAGLPGAIATTKGGLRLGMQVILGWAAFGLIGGIGALCYSLKNKERYFPTSNIVVPTQERIEKHQ